MTNDNTHPDGRNPINNYTPSPPMHPPPTLYPTYCHPLTSPSEPTSTSHPTSLFKNTICIQSPPPPYLLGATRHDGERTSTNNSIATGGGTGGGTTRPLALRDHSHNIPPGDHPHLLLSLRLLPPPHPQSRMTTPFTSFSSFSVDTRVVYSIYPQTTPIKH